MFSKFFFFLIFIFSVNAYSINLPQIEENPKIIKIIKAMLEEEAEDGLLDQGIFSTRYIGLSSLDCIPGIETIIERGLIKAAEYGDSFSLIELNDLLQNEYHFDTLKIFQKDEFKKAFEIGLITAIENGKISKINSFIDFAEKKEIRFSLLRENIQESFQKGISNLIAGDLFGFEQDFDKFLNIMNKFGMERSKENLKKAIEEGILKLLRWEISTCPFSGNSFESIKKICKKYEIDIQLSEISNIENAFYVGLEKILYFSIYDIWEINQKIQYMKTQKVNLDISQTRNINKHLKFRMKEAFILGKEYELEDIKKFVKEYKINIQKESEEELEQVDNDEFEDEIKYLISLGETDALVNTFKFLNIDNIEITLSKIPNIKTAFVEGICDELHVYKTTKLFDFAQKNNMDFNFIQIIHAGIRNYLSEGEKYSTKRLIEDAKDMGITIVLQDISGIKKAFEEGVIRGIESNNIGLIQDIDNYAKDNGVILQLEDVFFEAIRRNVVNESVLKIKSFINFSNECEMNIELSKVPNIIKAFQEGLKKSFAEDDILKFEYLNQLAIVNGIELDLKD